MPSPEVFAAFAAASLALLIVPGPSVLYIVTRSVDQGKAAGLVSVLGIHTGSIVHVAAAALGLSAILASSALAFGIVKYAGAAYLIWLGIKAIRDRGEERTEPRRREHSLARIYAQGVVVNVLNPKTALFFLAFLPQFVDAQRGSVALQIVVLGSLFNISGTIVNIAVAYLASSAGRWIGTKGPGEKAFRWLTASVFIGLGLRLALGDRK